MYLVTTYHRYRYKNMTNILSVVWTVIRMVLADFVTGVFHWTEDTYEIKLSII